MYTYLSIYLSLSLYIYIYIYIYRSPPLRSSSRSPRSLLRSSDCQRALRPCSVLKIRRRVNMVGVNMVLA